MISRFLPRAVLAESYREGEVVSGTEKKLYIFNVRPSAPLWPRQKFLVIPHRSEFCKNELKRIQLN